MRRSSLAALTLLFTSIPALSAQGNGSADPSSMRIRLVPADASWKPMTGTLVSIGADTIHFVLDGKGDTSRVLTADLNRIERSTSRRSRLGRGILMGVLIGGVAGGGAGYALKNADAGEISAYMVPAGIGAGVLLGGVIGGIWGASSHQERWEAVPTVSADPTHSGAEASAGVRVGFVSRISF